MPACDVQREIDMTSKSEVSGVSFTLRYTLLWPSLFFFFFFCFFLAILIKT